MNLQDSGDGANHGYLRAYLATMRHVAYHRWSAATDFARGSFDGTVISGDAVVLESPTETTGTWTSPPVHPGFDLTELVASWNADTPAGTWLQLGVRGTPDTGGTSSWYILGRWTSSDSELRRTSVTGQGNDVATVATDTLVVAAGRSLSAWQLRVTLCRTGLGRTGGTTRTPRLIRVGAMASAIPTTPQPVSPTGAAAAGGTLDVPTYSQELHVGEYPQWDGGGEAWCSPTSIAMVLDYWRSGPTPDDYAWVESSCSDPQVDHAARYVYDYAYEGAGNWAFNTAYAGQFGLEAFVTRLRSLTEAEQFISAGVPLVVSVSFSAAELSGAGYDTRGHLMVIVGFSDTGDVVVNDPASHLIPDNAQVRTTYGRAEFETAWGRSGGIAYVIHPPGVPLPPPPAEPNW